MEVLRRWGPVLGTVAMAILTVLRLVGVEVPHDIAPLEVGAAGAGAIGAALKVASHRRKAHGRLRSRSWLLLLAVLPSLQGCMSLEGARLGSQARLQQPSSASVLEFVCLNDDAGAVGYLALQQFAWLGDARRVEELQHAKAEKAAGKCPCPETRCGQ